MVVRIAQSKYHVTMSADVMLGTIWRIVRKRRLEEGDNGLMAPLTKKLVKTFNSEKTKELMHQFPSW